MCQSEVSELNELHNDFKDEGLMVAGIAVDALDSDKVQKFIEDFATLYLILLDDGRVSIAYGVLDKVPVTVVVDREGWIVFHASGFHSKEDLLSVIKPLL